jgi:hypothetical protein
VIPVLVQKSAERPLHLETDQWVDFSSEYRLAELVNAISTPAERPGSFPDTVKHTARPRWAFGHAIPNALTS